MEETKQEVTGEGQQAVRAEKMQQKPEVAPKKKKMNGWLKLLIILIVIVIVLAIAASATGVYAVPGVSSVFGMNKPKDLGIKASPEALASLEKKIPMEIKSEQKSYGDLSQVFVGTLPYKGKTTDEEITSFLQRFEGNNPIFSGTQVKFIEGGMELSSMVNYQINAPAYAKVMVTRTGTQSIALDVVEGKLGIFNVPEEYLQQVEDWAEDQINTKMNEIEGFSMTSLEYHDGISDFNGSFPKTVYSNARGWSGLLLE